MGKAPTQELMWVGFVFFIMLAILFETLIITGCIPPLSGQASVLSNFHLLELAVPGTTQTVRFSYVAFCTSGLNTSNKTPSQICSTIGSAFNPIPAEFAAKLPNINRQLFNLAFILNRVVFPVLPAATLSFIVIGAVLAIVHFVLRNSKPQQAKFVMLGIFACFGLSIAFAMTSAVAVTLVTAAVVNVANNSILKPGLGSNTFTQVTATRGEIAFRLHWTCFAVNLVVMGLAAVILPKSGGGGGGGGGDDDFGGGGDEDGLGSPVSEAGSKRMSGESDAASRFSEEED